MTIVDLLALDSRGRRSVILAVASVAGLANAFSLLVINSAAQAPETASLLTFLVFALAVAVYVVAARYTSHQMNAAIEAGLHSVKTRIVAKIERAEFGRIERIGTSEIFDRVTQNVTAISSVASQVGGILQSMCISACAVVYLLWLSPAAFAVLVPLQVAAVYIYASRRRVLDRWLDETAKTRVRFLDRLMDLLRGAKEVRFSRARSREVLKDFAQTSAQLRDVSANVNRIFDENLLFLTCNLYIMLGALVFVVPQYVHVEPKTMAKLVAALLFVWGSVQSGVGGYSAYVETTQALGEIKALEEKLDGAADRDAAPETQSDPWAGEPGRIEASQIEYIYPSGKGDGTFHIGPINLTVEAGEIVFIAGGNGAGKSTLLKVLCGLYPPTRGALKVRGVPVEPGNVAAYREMISAIFSDFHLFSKVYGLLDVDPEAVKGLLRQMQIEHKTSFQGGQFTKRNLSTGQRKRLAMIVALLEDRPIFVLDEWAADQDPEFRRYFYEELLPSLKSRGKTVIAVSHDDRYFHCADRLMIMEYGEVRSVEAVPHAAAARPGAEERG
ncbi:MAG TPA: cyclic peptide export ABC transporter [Polyangiaceae bacterium]|nr:cyclic peptide export ABC transporter [Polyangiaceae bacterium]